MISVGVWLCDRNLQVNCPVQLLLVMTCQECAGSVRRDDLHVCGGVGDIAER